MGVWIKKVTVYFSTWIMRFFFFPLQIELVSKTVLHSFEFTCHWFSVWRLSMAQCYVKDTLGCCVICLSFMTQFSTNTLMWWCCHTKSHENNGDDSLQVHQAVFEWQWRSLLLCTRPHVGCYLHLYFSVFNLLIVFFRVNLFYL